MKKVLLIVAHYGFQPLEYGIPKKILEDNGVEVVTASDKSGKAISALTQEKIKVDLVLDNIVVENYDGIFLIGGPGALEYLDNEVTHRIIQEAKDNNKLFGAICISPRILAKAGVLSGKKVTGWNKDGQLDEILIMAGAEYIKKPVVVDGKLITGWGPDAASEFGQTILEKILI